MQSGILQQFSVTLNSYFRRRPDTRNVTSPSRYCGLFTLINFHVDKTLSASITRRRKLIISVEANIVLAVALPYLFGIFTFNLARVFSNLIRILNAPAV